ncbi:unnamed protein product [Rotaria sp. Silwood1]|nr:unnamed protein product [Rotaria sp. Silwood1]
MRYNPGSGLASTGTVVAGYTTSGGSGSSQLNGPTAIFLDLNRTLYILDNLNYRVQKWIYGQPLGFTVAGGRGSGTTLDKISTGQGLFVDDQSSVYVSEIGNDRVTRWDNTIAGVIVAGNGTAGSALNQLQDPWGIYVDSNYTVFVADRGNHRVQMWERGASTGMTVAGQSGVSGPWSYQFNLPTSITFDQYGYMYIMDSGNNRIQRWWPGSTYGTTVASSASMYNPRGLTIDPLGNLVLADCSNHRVVSFAGGCGPTTTTTIAPLTNPPNEICDAAYWNSTIRIVAGSTGSYSTALNRLYTPTDLFFDGNGYMYVVDYGNNRIQRFPPGSTSSTSAVTVAGYTTTGGSSFSELNDPYSIFVDSEGTMYIMDTTNYRVIKWRSGEPLGFIVAGGHGTGTTLDKIGTSYAIYLDDQSNIYISEYSNHRVTIWLNGNTTAGNIVAGNNTAGSALNQLRNPWGLFVDSIYGLYVVDRGNHRIQYWEKGNGVTLCGQSGVAGSWSNQLSSPTSITLDQFGNMYIMDFGNNRIQQWAPGATFGITVASASMSGPRGLAFDPSGNLATADTGNHRIVLFSVICRKYS